MSVRLMAPPPRPRRRATMAAKQASLGAFYEAAGDGSPELQSWGGPIAEPNDEWQWSRDGTVGRIRDLQRNDGWAAAGLERQVDNLAGLGWRFSANVDGRALSNVAGREIPATEIRALNRAMEAEWRVYAQSALCWGDIRRRSTIDQKFALAFYHRLRDGEAAARAAYVPGEGVYGTRYEGIDPDRIQTPDGRMEDATLRQGIELNAHSAPIAAYIRTRHPGEWMRGAPAWERVPRFDRLGLPVFLHDYKGVRENQVRGVPDLAPVVKTFKSLGRYSDADLQAAIVQSLYAMTIETMETPSQVADRLSVQKVAELEAARLSHYQKFPPRFPQGVRALILKSGDKASLNAVTRPSGDFVARERALLSRIAAQLGQSGSGISMDWSGWNYASGRLSLLQTFRWVEARQLDFARNIASPFIMVWLAEAVSLGRIVIPSDWPDFFENIEAYSRCNWIVPKMGWVDPLKEAEAAEKRMQMGIRTMQRECAEHGEDWEEVVEQIAVEIAECRAKGQIHPRDPAYAKAPSSGRPDPDEEGVQALITAELERRGIAA